MNLILTSIFCALLSVSFADILVKTFKGTVRGRQLISPGNRTFYGFTGIPYAKPPLGELRFQAPVEVDSWNGVLNATSDPDMCFQVNSDNDRENENCLYINVFTPALDLVNSRKKLPVVLTIYGGSFRSGSAGYGRGGPDWFVERDIVVVSFNYRVGPMGFLSTGDTVIPGNAGLKDQQFALKWTYDNIELFGGDRSHITLQGQSAGAASVTYQLLHKENAGMIKAAVAQSGSAICPWAWIKDNLPYTIRLARVVNNDKDLSSNSSAALLKYLQGASARDIDKASFTLYSSGIPLPTLEPEHDGAFITESMYELLASGNIIRVPLLIGINSEEEIAMAKDIPKLQAKAANYDHNPASLAPSQFSNDNRTIAGNLLKQVYVGTSTFSVKLGSVVSYTSDSVFTKSVIRFGELYSKYSPVYFYQFSYKGPMGRHDDHIDGADNVSHGEEYYYMGVTKSGNYDNTKYDRFPAGDVLTHWRMIEMWSNFYKYGNPTPEKVDLLSNLTFPMVSAGSFKYVNINGTLEVRDTPKSPRYNVWRYVFDAFGVRPFVVY